MVRESATVIIPSKHNTLCYASPPHRPIPGVRGDSLYRIRQNYGGGSRISD
jgi:hypothetical protein